jgi:hypothetical protein
MTTLTELGPAGIARAGSFVKDAISAMRRFLRGFEFMVGMAALFAWTLIDAGAPDGWLFGVLAGAAWAVPFAAAKEAASSDGIQHAAAPVCCLLPRLPIDVRPVRVSGIFL